MEELLKHATARMSALWGRRHGVAERLQEDRGSVSVENVLWVAVYATLAVTIGGIIYQLVFAKAQSIHF
jgi:membrane protein implicated in regulation of membrane protease activity